MSGWCRAHWIITSPQYVESNGLTQETQLQLRVKLCLGDELNERIIDLTAVFWHLWYINTNLHIHGYICVTIAQF